MQHVAVKCSKDLSELSDEKGSAYGKNAYVKAISLS